MVRRFSWGLLVSCALLALGGCAGFRGGWESVAYVGDRPDPAPLAATSPHESRNRAPLVMPGLSLSVWIDNRLRDHDRQVWLYAVPVSVDPRDKQPDTVASGKTRVSLLVAPQRAGFTFRPRQAVLAFGDARHHATAGYAQVRQASTTGTQRWELQAIADSWELTSVAEATVLVLEFDVPSPSPLLPDIALDLSEALAAAGGAPLPLIRFVPVRWKEGYT